MERYPVYKDSGVEWVGEIPHHWHLKRGDWVFEYRKEPISNVGVKSLIDLPVANC